jgi:hypothetical protein
MLKIAAALAAVPLGLVTVTASTGIVLVDVQERGPSGHHIVVPLPLAALQAAAFFIPPQPAHFASRHADVARNVLLALRGSSDGELLRVEEPGQQVVISKGGDMLHVQVHEPGQDVMVNVPLSLAMAALPGEGKPVSVAALAGALSSARFTDLVEVRSDEERVKVSVY